MFGRRKKKDNALAQYPCSVFLHNALRCLQGCRYDVAYEEICYAIVRSGGKLTDEERECFEAVKGGANDEL